MHRPGFWLVFLLLVAVASPAIAARARSNGLVLVAEGSDREAKSEIVDAISHDMRVQSADELLAAVANEGVTGSVAEALSGPRTRKPAIAAIQRAMRAAGAAAVLSIRTKRNRAGEREMHVVLLVSTQTAPMIEEDFNLSPGESANAQLGPLLSASLPELVRSSSSDAPRPPAAPATAPTNAVVTDGDRSGESRAKRARKKKEAIAAPPAEAGDESISASERDHAITRKRTIGFANATVVGEAGVGVGGRKLEYSDPWAGRLRPHSAPGIAVYGVGAEVYPGATSDMEVLKDVGLVGRFTGSLEVESTTSDGQTARGSLQRYALGLRARIPTGDRKTSPLIGVEGTYGAWSFAFSGLDQAVEEAPSVDYKYFRAGADARVPFGSLAFLAGLGYMSISSAGAYSDRFPNATVAGVDALIGATLPIASMVELRFTVTYARIFSSANPNPGAEYVAGGALDQYLLPMLGASTVF